MAKGEFIELMVRMSTFNSDEYEAMLQEIEEGDILDPKEVTNAVSTLNYHIKEHIKKKWKTKYSKTS